MGLTQAEMDSLDEKVLQTLEWEYIVVSAELAQISDTVRFLETSIKMFQKKKQDSETLQEELRKKLEKLRAAIEGTRSSGS